MEIWVGPHVAKKSRQKAYGFFSEPAYGCKGENPTEIEMLEPNYPVLATQCVVHKSGTQASPGSL